MGDVADVGPVQFLPSVVPMFLLLGVVTVTTIGAKTLVGLSLALVP